MILADMVDCNLFICQFCMPGIRRTSISNCECAHARNLSFGQRITLDKLFQPSGVSMKNTQVSCTVCEGSNRSDDKIQIVLHYH